MQKRALGVALIAAALVVLGLAASAAQVTAAPPAQAPKGDPTRGAYVFAVAKGCGCHSEGAAGFLAGGAVFEGPFGKVYARNITPDEETGIGKWTEQDIVTALRTGKRPDGEMLFPVMPYPWHSAMADQDAYDLAAFIKTAPAVKNAVPPRELTVPVPPFTPAVAPAVAPTSGLERGAYLVNSVATCGECHTPTDANGAPDMSKALAGQFFPGEGVIPNITPDTETGIGAWTEEQIVTLLKTGKRPDGSSVGGLMALVIEFGFKQLTDSDALAIAQYLKTVPAVKNTPQAPAELPKTGGSLNNLPVVLTLAALGAIMLAAGVVVMRTNKRTL